MTEQLQIRQCKLDSGDLVSFDGSVLTVLLVDAEAAQEVTVTPADALALQWLLTGRKARGSGTRPTVKAKAEPKGGAS